MVAQVPLSVDRLTWMQGCWEMTSGARLVEEHWTRPRGGIMLGVGRTTRDGQLVEYEHVVIRLSDGALAYEAHPSGQPSAVFTTREMDDTSVVFENATHDFPQRVGYRKQGDAGLQAWVEGSINGRAQRIDFTYVRVACP